MRYSLALHGVACENDMNINPARRAAAAANANMFRQKLKSITIHVVRDGLGLGGVGAESGRVA